MTRRKWKLNYRTAIGSVLVAIGLLAILWSTFKSPSALTVVNTTAQTGHAKDIQAAVNQVVASGGIGTVHVPAGTWNFVNVNEPIPTVEVPAGVNIIGDYSVNGDTVTWNTVLQIPWGLGGDPYGTWTGSVKSTPVCFKITGNGDPNKPSTFSGIKMVGYRSIDPEHHLFIKPLVVNDVTDYRVSYCYFEHMVSGFTANGKFCRGVVDHCWFINYKAQVTANIATCDTGYGCSYFRTFTENLWDPTSEVVGKYTTYTHFIEDCYFSKWRHCVASNDGAVYVFRYSTISDDFGMGSLDAHGTYNVVGTRAIEVYNNQFLRGMYGWNRLVIGLRGGAAIVFNNYVQPYDPSAQIGYSYLMSMINEGSVQKCWPNDVYVWGNSGTTTVSNQAPSVIIENVNYHFEQMPGYTPYQYPHPLVRGEPVPTPGPSPTPTPTLNPSPSPRFTPSPTPTAPPSFPSNVQIQYFAEITVLAIGSIFVAWGQKE